MPESFANAAARAGPDGRADRRASGTSHTICIRRMLDHVGLAAALRKHCAEFAHEHGFASPGPARRSGESSRVTSPSAAYRIVQEALRNVHQSCRRSREADVTVVRTPERLRPARRGPGRGFDPAAASHSGLGLLSMEERARLIGGERRASPRRPGGRGSSSRLSRRVDMLAQEATRLTPPRLHPGRRSRHRRRRAAAPAARPLRARGHPSATARTLVAAAVEHQPDIIVADISMPGFDGLQALRRSARQGVTAKVIMLTMFADPEVAEEALAAGANGYVIKHSAGEELLKAIHEVLGRTHLHHAVRLQARASRADPQASGRVGKHEGLPRARGREHISGVEAVQDRRLTLEQSGCRAAHSRHDSSRAPSRRSAMSSMKATVIVS